MAIGDVSRVVAVFTDGTTGKEQTTGFHIEHTAVTAPSMTAIGADVVDWWNTDLAGAGSAQKNFHPNDIALTRVEMRRVDPLEPVVQTYAVGLPITGVETVDPLPASSAILVSLRTPNIGRRYRGRCYLPRFSEAELDTSGGLTAADALLVANQFRTLIATIAVDAAKVIVYSPEDLDATPPRSGTIKTDVTEVFVDRRARTQRRRSLRTPVYVVDTV